MSLLDNLPHECTIRRRTNLQGTLGKGKVSFTDEYTEVPCWEQPMAASESSEYQKRGIVKPRIVFFNADYNLNERHQILITKRQGATVSSPVPLDVKDVKGPDDSVGMQLLWQVVVEYKPAREQ